MSILKRIGSHKDKFELEVQVHSITAKLKPGLYKLVVKGSRSKKLETPPVQYNLNSGKIVLEFPVRINIAMYKKSSKYLKKNLSLKLVQLSGSKLVKNGKGTVDMSDIALTNIGLFRHDVPLKKCSDKNASVNLTLNLNPVEISSKSSRSNSRTSSFAHADESPKLKETGFFGRERSISVASSSKGSSKQTPGKSEAKNENEHEMSFTNYSEREQEVDDTLYDEDDIFTMKPQHNKSFLSSAGEVESMAQAAPIAMFSSSENESSDSDSIASGKGRVVSKAPSLTLTSAKVELSITPSLDKSSEFVTPIKPKPSNTTNSLKISTKQETHISNVIYNQTEETEVLIAPKKETKLYTNSYKEQQDTKLITSDKKEFQDYTMSFGVSTESTFKAPTATNKKEFTDSTMSFSDSTESKFKTPILPNKKDFTDYTSITYSNESKFKTPTPSVQTDSDLYSHTPGDKSAPSFTTPNESKFKTPTPSIQTDSDLYSHTPGDKSAPSFTTPTLSNKTDSKFLTPTLSNKTDSKFLTPTLSNKTDSKFLTPISQDQDVSRLHTPSLTDKNISSQEEPIPFKDLPKPTTSIAPQAAIPMEAGRDHSPTFSDNQPVRNSLENFDTQGSHIVDVDYDGSGSEIGSHLRKQQTGSSISTSVCYRNEGLSSPSDIEHDKFEEITNPKQFVEINYEDLRKSISMQKSSDSSSSEEEPIRYDETPAGLPITSMTNIKPNAFSKDETLEKNEFQSGIVGGNKRTSACTGCMIF